MRQAKEYFDIGFVVHAIKRPDRSIAHDQDQLSALHHGFDDLALKLAEERTPRNRGEATEATQRRILRPQSWPRGLQGRSCSRCRIESKRGGGAKEVAHRIDPPSPV